MTDIIRAAISDTDDIAPLFDAYRQFYDQPSDLHLARDFIETRLKKDEAIIFLAHENNGTAVGFTLLYPTFCSVAAAPVFVLYDLFVTPTARRNGIAAQLIQTAQSYAAARGAAWLKLETAHTNQPGQALYEKLGWERDDEFYTYYFTLDAEQ